MAWGQLNNLLLLIVFDASLLVNKPITKIFDTITLRSDEKEGLFGGTRLHLELNVVQLFSNMQLGQYNAVCLEAATFIKSAEVRVL